MNLEFIKQINEYIIESLIEARDDEILSLIDAPTYPSSKDIATASLLIEVTIKQSQRNRLERKKAEFTAYKSRQKQIEPLHRPVTKMISDIVATMQNTDNIPEGILLAFREQQESVSDEDIALIWQSLVELGLIDPKGKD